MASRCTNSQRDDASFNTRLAFLAIGGEQKLGRNRKVTRVRAAASCGPSNRAPLQPDRMTAHTPQKRCWRLARWFRRQIILGIDFRQKIAKRGALESIQQIPFRLQVRFNHDRAPETAK